MSAWLAAYTTGRTIGAACAAVDVSRDTVLNWRRLSSDDPPNPDYCLEVVDEDGATQLVPFHKLEATARDASTDEIIAEGWRRAVDGIERPVFQRGALVGHERIYSDLLLMFLAKQRDPSYRENYRVDVVHQGKLEIDSARDRLAAKLEASIAASVIDVTPARPALPAPAQGVSSPGDDATSPADGVIDVSPDKRKPENP